MKIEQHQVYVAGLDPTIGAEMKKTRPVVVISPTNMNQALNKVVVCPITSVLHPEWRTRIKCEYGEVAVDQIRTLDKRRLTKHLGGLEPVEIEEVRQVVRDLYG